VSASDALIGETARRLIAAVAPSTAGRAGEGVFMARAWAALEEAGFTTVGLPEESGGSGGTVADAAAVVRIAGAHALPLPLAENALLGGWLLTAAGHRIPRGPLAVLPARRTDRITAEPDEDGWRVDGAAGRVAWGRDAAHLVALVAIDGRCGVALLPAGSAPVVAGANLAGEPRDTLRLDGVRVGHDAVRPAPDGVDVDALLARGAATRVLLIAGALQRVLDITLTYAAARVQFGKPILSFQAVGQQVARLAEEAAMAAMAAEMVTRALAAGRLGTEVAVAKSVAGEAASLGCRVAHQVHGAIGITREYELHLLTRRLWSWRDEFGGERSWNERLGAGVLTAGPGGVWDLVSADLGGPATATWEHPGRS
jgi:acyl-CoA dehydrogenase